MNYLCVHSHFYQPPRENPWLESIEMQDSAYPYHDWNDRITAECYHPNGAARILDDKDRIVRIVNNYTSMSFNVGPTLLSWMEVHAPEAYALILEANRESRKRFSGHGNAIAQVYNHIIMPLANRRDKLTQIRWGIADFESRFGHKPEGMWLAETAVDLESLDLMAQHGIRFTILSPYQAKGPIDTGRPYKVQLPEGRSIAVFFYHGPVSQGVAFERLLENGERFAQRLLQAVGPATGDTPQLAHIATDGETYGHHHRHGEMAFAYAIEYIGQRKLAKLTNYGEYLEKFPPTYEVEIIENSAWSCSHGIGRWSRDCGCSTGSHWGWNQAWRGPLREAYDWLRDTIAPEFERLASKYVEDPWAARDSYIAVVLDRTRQTYDDFLAPHSRGNLTDAQRIELSKLLEMQRHAMLMYTSCGWFFDDLGGIETVQTMQYAGRALQLFEELSGRSIRQEFMQLLAKAHSNDKQHGSGADIFEAQVLTAVVDLPKLAAHYAISSLFENYARKDVVHCFECESLQRRDSKAGHLRAATGIVRLTSTITGESGVYAFGVIHFGDHNITGAVTQQFDAVGYEKAQTAFHRAFESADIPALIRILDRDWGGADAYTLRSLFRDEQRKILKDILEDTVQESEGAFHRLYSQNLPLMRFLGSLKSPLPRVFQATAATALNTLMKRALSGPTPDRVAISMLLEEAAAARVELDITTLEYQLRNRISQAAYAFGANPKNQDLLDNLIAWVKVRPVVPFQLYPWSAQNYCYAVLRGTYPRMAKRAQSGEQHAKDWVASFKELCEALMVRIQE
jgi:alpha-amylase/alpha-mannosidase (GH57 family)